MENLNFRNIPEQDKRRVKARRVVQELNKRSEWEFQWHIHREAVGELFPGRRWNFEMLVFVEGGTSEYPEKNPRSTLVGGECSHNCAIPASLKTI